MFEGMRASRRHNRALREGLELVRMAAGSAADDHDLVDAIHRLDKFPSPLQFDKRFTDGVALMAAVPILVAGGVCAYLQNQTGLIVCGALIALTLMIWLGVRSSGKSKLSQLSDEIHYKSTLFDYGLKAEQFDPKGEARRLGGRFDAFQRGNYSREMRSILAARYEGEEHSFDYRLFHFHYVDQRTETYVTTDSNGRTQVRTRTVYDHYDRYGFIAPFGFARDITIAESMLGFFTSSWKTSSESFNRHFSVRAVSEMAAAKFLVPKVILEIEDAGQALGGMALEINRDGDLCLSFTDSDMISINRQHGLETPAAFAEEINGCADQPRLKAALGFIHTLMKYTDNNFEAAAPQAERKHGPWNRQ